MDEELFHTNSQRRWFLEIKSTPGENAVKAVKMTMKGLEYYINLLDKAVVGSEIIDQF